MSNTTSPDTPTDSPRSAFNNAFNVFDSPDSKETIIYLCIAILALIGIGIALKAIFWISDKFRYPGWKIWSARTRQNLAILWTTSWLSLAVELFFLLTAIFSVATFIYVTILIADKVPQGKTRSEILRIPWLYWTEFVFTIMCGIHLLFRLYTSRNGLYSILDASIVLEVIAGIPLLTSPFRGQFAWNFQYLRIIRLHHALSFLSHHPLTAFSGKTYLLISYIFSTICMIFGAGGFFFVLENKYFNENGLIRDMVDAMYYVIVTVSTTGYGDITPKTVLGRIGAILLALCALIYIPLRVARLVSILSISTSGVVKKPGNHVIVCAATESDFSSFVDEFFHPDRAWTDTTLALMAPNSEIEASIQGIVTAPGNELRLQALQGSLANPSDYGYYHLDTASGVVLMSDKSKGPAGDAVTLVTAMSLVQRYPELPLFVQVQSSSSKNTALARGITNAICIQELRKGILIQNSLHPGFAPFILNLMRSSSEPSPAVHTSNLWLNEYNQGSSNEFYSHAPLFEFQGLSYAETSLYLAKKYGIVLIGIIEKNSRLVAKKKKVVDETDTPLTSSNTVDTSTSSTLANSAKSTVGHSILKEGEREKQQTGRTTFDRHRRSLQAAIDSGDRVSIDLRPGAHQAIVQSMLNPDEFELVTDWNLVLNPGPDFVIQEGHEGIVLAQDEEQIQAITCDDIALIQEIAHEVSAWADLDPSQRNRHLNPEFTSPDPASNINGDAASEEEEPGPVIKSSLKKPKTEIESQGDTKSGFIKVKKAESKAKVKFSQKNTAFPALDGNSHMVNLSNVSSVKVAKEIKEGYELVKDYPLNLADNTLANAATIISDHILILGDWETDMYDLVLGFRSKVLSKHGSLRPLVFLGPSPPNYAIWARVSIFKDVYVVIGSQLDATDLVKGGIINAHSVLVMARYSQLGQACLGDSKSLTTFLIAEKLTRAHITIELLSASSLQLLLKGHAALYKKKPIQKDPLREEFDAAKASYKEISKLETTSNPYFACGHVFVTSFLDSLIGLAFYNQQIVGVLQLLTSPEAIQTVTVRNLVAAYPALKQTKKKKKHRRRKSRENTEPTKKVQKKTTVVQESEMDSLTATYDDLHREQISAVDEEAYNITFYNVFKTVMKHSSAIVLAVRRSGDKNSIPYVVTAPDPKMKLLMDDVCLILDNQSMSLSSDAPQINTVSQYETRTNIHKSM